MGDRYIHPRESSYAMALAGAHLGSYLEDFIKKKRKPSNSREDVTEIVKGFYEDFVGENVHLCDETKIMLESQVLNMIRSSALGWPSLLEDSRRTIIDRFSNMMTMPLKIAGDGSKIRLYLLSKMAIFGDYWVPES